ncbi:MAG: hypothetical protein RR895_00550 [Hydrogenoanaerobacterium sp.]
MLLRHGGVWLTVKCKTACHYGTAVYGTAVYGVAIKCKLLAATTRRGMVVNCQMQTACRYDTAVQSKEAFC